MKENYSKVINTIKEKIKLTKSQRIKCNAIIHATASINSLVGAGLAQIPLSDTIPITASQIAMVIALGKVFGLDLSEGVAKAIIEGFTASFLGRGAAELLVGWFPGVGNVLNACTAGTLTELIGWMSVIHFQQRIAEDIDKYKVYGEEEGYNRASKAYEEKFREQAEEFEKATEEWNRYYAHK